MTELESLRRMLSGANIEFTTDDRFGGETEVEFTPDEMTEEVIFVFDSEGKLKEVY